MTTSSGAPVGRAHGNAARRYDLGIPGRAHRRTAGNHVAIEAPVRAAEVAGVLSLATDLGTGQPLEHALRTALLAVGLGELASCSTSELRAAFYASLLHTSGCTSDGHETQMLFGDDISPRAAFALVDGGRPEEVVGFLRSHVGTGRPDPVREAMADDVIEHGLPMIRETFASHCEVAQRFAGWLGLDAGTLSALQFVYERWDGHGLPGAASGDGIPVATRLLHIARDMSLFRTAAGAAEAVAVIRARSGAAYDPRLADLAVAHGDRLIAELDDTRLWDAALAQEPVPKVWIAGDRVDAAFLAIGSFADLKSPFFHGHSAGVAELAEAAGWRLGLSAADVARLRRAALAHDLGRVGVSNAIWEKPTPLGFGEWERVRLHPHFTDRAFAQSDQLAPIGRLAGSHHERLDGSGYHRGTAAAGLDRSACILAAADSYQAICEPRAHRPAREAAAAGASLLAEVEAGRLDPVAVDAVLAAAGHRVPTRRRGLPAGITDRELEVLVALVGGHSNQEIGELLGISPKTVGHHVQRVYAKAGVRTRAGATVWAFEHALVPHRSGPPG